MSRIVFDHNVPATLRRFLPEHDVRTAEEQGWQQISNGELIRRSEQAGFEILLTCDQNLSYQQNLSQRTISLIVLGSNIWPLVERSIPDIAAAILRAFPASFEFIEIDPGSKNT